MSGDLKKPVPKGKWKDNVPQQVNKSNNLIKKTKYRRKQEIGQTFRINSSQQQSMFYASS